MVGEVVFIKTERCTSEGKDIFDICEGFPRRSH